MNPSIPDLTPATIRRSTQGMLTVEVESVWIGEAPDYAASIRVLCEYAVKYQLTLIAVYNSGAGKQHMTIDKTGYVAMTAAPAPTAAMGMRPPQVDPAKTMGESEHDAMTSRAWVERYILDPGPEPEPAPRKRRRFGKR